MYNVSLTTSLATLFFKKKKAYFSNDSWSDFNLKNAYNTKLKYNKTWSQIALMKLIVFHIFRLLFKNKWRQGLHHPRHCAQSETDVLDSPWLANSKISRRKSIGKVIFSSISSDWSHLVKQNWELDGSTNLARQTVSAKNYTLKIQIFFNWI